MVDVYPLHARSITQKSSRTTRCETLRNLVILLFAKSSTLKFTYVTSATSAHYMLYTNHFVKAIYSF